MITNKKIVLTGAGSGIGLETLKLLCAEKSNTVFAVDKNIEKIKDFADNCIVMEADVSTKESVDLIFDKAVETMGDINIFFANAGYPYYEALDYTDWDRCKAMFETNVFSPIYSYEKYRDFLNGREGHYAITVSAIGKMAMPGYTLYSASKFAMHGFQQGLRYELPKNIKLTCLYPIATDTNFFNAASEKKITERPFPVQGPAHVAKQMVKGLEKGKKIVNPSKLFTLSGVLFAICPPVKAVYLKMEKNKLHRFLNR